MELAQLGHRDIGSIVMWNAGEWCRWCVPQRAQKVGDTLEVLGDSNNRHRKNQNKWYQELERQNFLSGYRWMG